VEKIKEKKKNKARKGERSREERGNRWKC